MASTLSLEELRVKSKQANDLIQKLKNQIDQIKLASTPEYVADKAKSLQQENEQLRKKVEELKVELEQEEAKNKNNPLANVTNQPKADTKPEVSKVEAAAVPNKETEKKAEKKQQEPKKASAPAKKEEPVLSDVNVSKLDIRIGKIVTCKKHPEAESLYVEEIDLGEGKLRTVCSGLVKFIELEKMQERLVVLLCNLKPAKLRGILSEAMVLCASTPEKVELLIPPSGAQIGDRVIVDGYEGEPAAECTTKNKIFDLVQVDLKTNDDLVATYKGTPLQIKGKGVLKSESLKNVPIK